MLRSCTEYNGKLGTHRETPSSLTQCGTILYIWRVILNSQPFLAIWDSTAVCSSHDSKYVPTCLLCLLSAHLTFFLFLDKHLYTLHHIRQQKFPDAPRVIMSCCRNYEENSQFSLLHSLFKSLMGSLEFETDYSRIYPYLNICISIGGREKFPIKKRKLRIQSLNTFRAL